MQGFLRFAFSLYTLRQLLGKTGAKHKKVWGDCNEEQTYRLSRPQRQWNDPLTGRSGTM